MAFEKRLASRKAAGVRQAEKHGHSGMAEELRFAIIQLDEQD
jgi:hypothetical protein